MCNVTSHKDWHHISSYSISLCPRFQTLLEILFLRDKFLYFLSNIHSFQDHQTWCVWSFFLLFFKSSQSALFFDLSVQSLFHCPFKISLISTYVIVMSTSSQSLDTMLKKYPFLLSFFCSWYTWLQIDPMLSSNMYFKNCILFSIITYFTLNITFSQSLPMKWHIDGQTDEQTYN